jgi:porphobilinogen synthase
MPNLPVRMRRLRHSAGIRTLVQEHHVHPRDLIYPLFIRDGIGIKRPISSMPGQFQWSIDMVLTEIADIVRLGISGVMLFGIPDHKDAVGSQNYDTQGIIPRAIRAIKSAYPELVVISDLCFCEYTDHGHCGLINTADSPYFNAELPDGYVLNDETLELLGRAAVVHAHAGADIIAPSGMMDGMVQQIRTSLDHNNYSHVSIMSYAIKYASGFYGPFRDAAESPPQFGDRSQYQMNPANQREALRELAIDIAEGADMVMVKPAMSYLDIIWQARHACHAPIAAYHVSGEYAMIHAAAQNGWIDLERCAMESLVSIKRAGADMIITYFAKDVARWTGASHD